MATVKKAAGSAKAPRFPLRIDDAELRRKLKQVAEAEGESQNEWIVDACLQRLRREGLSEAPPESIEAQVRGRDLADALAVLDGTPHEPMARGMVELILKTADSYRSHAAKSDQPKVLPLHKAIPPKT